MAFDSELTLHPLSARLGGAFKEYADEFRTYGEPQFWHPKRDEGFAAYIARLARVSRGEIPGFVRMSTFWFMQGPTMVGESRIRHELPPELADAGHIGCAVRPGARGAGIGTRILAMTLEQASVVGHSSVSLTCDSDNAASARMIAKNGGLLISSATSDNTGKERNRYVVQLRKRGV